MVTTSSGLDPRIRELHIARYGATDDVEDYLRTLESLHCVPDDKRGENHHMLAQSIWVEYNNLRAHPWNRLRVSRALHTALTELQSRFEERLRSAAWMMKGLTREAFLERCRRGGRIGGKIGGKRRHELHPTLASEAMKRTHELHPNLAREAGKRTKELHPNLFSEAGKLAHDLGVGIHAPEHRGKGGKRMHELYPNLVSETMKQMHELHPNFARENWKRTRELSIGIFALTPAQRLEIAKMANCTRWNIRRGKPCICGHHSSVA